MEEYLIQGETLTSLGDAARSMTGRNTKFSLSEIIFECKNAISQSNTNTFFVGMMPPNNSVGNDGDIFFLV